MIKKPRFWDYKSPNLISKILLPFTAPYLINDFILNFKKKFKTKKILSICVGNIYLGGTGKTPTTIKLFQILKKFNKKIVTAKKFYPSHYDEIKLLQKKTILLLGKKRSSIIDQAIKAKKEIIIFDDGLQDLQIDYSLKFVCFDALSWIGNGYLVPSGPLRQRLSYLRNIDGVFIKNIRKPDKKKVTFLKKINPNIKVFNTQLKILNKKRFNLNHKYLIFSGIGNTDNFKKILETNNFKIAKFITFSDHHQYTYYEIDKMINLANTLSAKIITTEKDFVKIPKKFKNKIKFIDIDLTVINERELIKFLKLKINEKY